MHPWKVCPFVIGIILVPAWSLDGVLDGSYLPSGSQHSMNIPDNEATYLSHELTNSQKAQRFSWVSSAAQKPDTTIVLLNWSRLQNVIFQASVYCSPLLEGIVEQVFVWNNQPNLKLEYDEHFSSTGCSPDRLQIYNSPSNLYFQARFMGCADSHSRYCFLQDDDYITRPEILINIHASFKISEQTPGRPSPITLLPSNDHLETDLLRVWCSHSGNGLNTSFAWLGHGTFLRQSQATEYLALLRQLSLNDEEMNMADNYFTILSGQLPNTWLTHTIELGGVHPFTVGVEGSDRNWRHIERAMAYLDEILHYEKPTSWPHFTQSESSRQHTAPCILNPCILNSNIPMLPTESTSNYSWTHGNQMRKLQSRRLANLGQEGALWYIDHPLSKAVDGDIETAFRSAGTAKAGDCISLTLLMSKPIRRATSNTGKYAIDLTYLVDADTASILHASSVEVSRDGLSWHSLAESSLTCFPTSLPFPLDSAISPPSVLGQVVSRQFRSPDSDKTTIPSPSLLECHTTFNLALERNSQLYTRTKLDRELPIGWSIYEVWLRVH